MSTLKHVSFVYAQSLKLQATVQSSQPEPKISSRCPDISDQKTEVQMEPGNTPSETTRQHAAVKTVMGENQETTVLPADDKLDLCIQEVLSQKQLYARYLQFFPLPILIKLPWLLKISKYL